MNFLGLFRCISEWQCQGNWAITFLSSGSGCASRSVRMFELELVLVLIQTQMAQKPMLRAEVGMRVRCANKASAEWFRRERDIVQIPRKICKKRGIFELDLIQTWLAHERKRYENENGIELRNNISAIGYRPSVMAGPKFISWTVSTLERGGGPNFLTSTHFLFSILTCAQRRRVHFSLLPAALASVSFGFVLVRVRDRPSAIWIWIAMSAAVPIIYSYLS